ncbi:cAMP-binding domain of CRP or a regulatory subunit of cAMP-dependent protein kinases [Marivirga sericea]|uniref:cAMP-binding domain of CRP or a regulatory subunit of cAMP-dependent protein kinases n=1 Tax=Marivirga sericea TaxID=1028 RepID=A0A1X7KWQ6_9BACT|nr:Crp/Fnr family transcriptional regulator [Marivirga sericea]SMG45314.1 cAMP-binding domain of CRP or a regulatory subunit of cAMP-dependent protein kinases [Marivirga sericea]
MTKTFELFAFLNQQEQYKNCLKKHISSKVYKKGQYIYKPSEEPHLIFELISGTVKVGNYAIDGTEHCYDILKPGDFFGNYRLLDGNFQEFAKPLTSVKVRQYELSYIKKLIFTDIQISELFTKYVVRRWSRAETRFFTVISEDTSVRIKRLYREFNVKIKDADGRAVNIFSLFSQKDIADLTGSSRQTVAHIFKKLNKDYEALLLDIDPVMIP